MSDKTYTVSNPSDGVLCRLCMDNISGLREGGVYTFWDNFENVGLLQFLGKNIEFLVSSTDITH